MKRPASAVDAGGAKIAEKRLRLEPAFSNAQQARTAVRDTVELLESILLHLPVTSLIRCLRVSKTFNSVMHDSKKIRRALFLEKEEDTTTWKYTNQGITIIPHPRDDTMRDVVNHSLTWMSRVSLGQMYELHDVDGIAFEHCNTLVTVNPALIPRVREPEYIENHIIRERNQRTYLLFDPTAQTDPSDSRLNMLLTQPPIQSLTLRPFIIRESDRRGKYRKVVVKNPKGIRLGDIVEQMGKQMNGWEGFLAKTPIIMFPPEKVILVNEGDIERLASKADSKTGLVPYVNKNTVNRGR